MLKNTTVYGFGKHKCAYAKVQLINNKFKFQINNIFGLTYFQNNIYYLKKIFKLFKLINLKKNTNFNIIVKGGGLSSQINAITIAIVKIFLKNNKLLKKIFKKYKLITSDSRKKERKKYGLKKARKASQFSKR